MPRITGVCRKKGGKYANLGKMFLHDLGTVVDGKNDVGDTCFSEGLDLVQDHGLVRELDKGLRKSEGLIAKVVLATLLPCGSHGHKESIMPGRGAREEERPYKRAQPGAKATHEDDC